MVMAAIFHGKLTPLLLLEGHQKTGTSILPQELRPSILPPTRRPKRPKRLKHHQMTQDRAGINTYLPMELFREIFLYGIEVNQMKSGVLASVCRHWRSVITSIASLWSTLRVGTWTETERVATWFQRAYPKKIVIDTQRDREGPSETPALAALQVALRSTSLWNELRISSFPPATLASRLDIQVSNTMKALKVLHIAAGCVHSPSFTHLLSLIPTEAPLCELRLHPPFASTHFLQPHWFPVLVNLTGLIVNGKDINEPFELLPNFTQLQIFEADRLRLPFYEPSTNLPLLCTLRKLQLRACSVQWMAGRQFPCLVACAILLPRHWEAIQQNNVQLPSCKKLTYHGYPMTTAQYFHVPEMRVMELRSHDYKDQRVYQHLRHLCTVDGRISNLTTLHLTFQSSEKALIKVLKYLVPLQELILSIAHPSPSWQNFLESLAAKSSTKEWPVWNRWEVTHRQLEKWCSSQIWHTNVLPRLKYLGVQCPKGFSQSERLENCPLFRLVGWTRAHLTPPLERLKVWEERGSMDDSAVDYLSTGYLNKHFGVLSKEHDAMIVMGMVTRCLIIRDNATPLFKLRSAVLFKHLQHLELICNRDDEIIILPYLEQIRTLEIQNGMIPEYSLNLDLPLTHTLQRLKLRHSTFSWMLGRTFKPLRELQIDWSFPHEKLSRHEGLQVGLPACISLELEDCPVDILRFLSCSNVQVFSWSQYSAWTTFDLAVLRSPHNFLFNLSSLQKLDIFIPEHSGLDSLIYFLFCGAWEQGAWRDIRSVVVEIRFDSLPEASHFLGQTVGHRRRYDKWWKTFTVTERYTIMVTVNASI